ncbi:mechanosensitive ion channel domain-containing protein [Xanthovirga aplysinae]|uniref:mechanosensitive ion channel domain-containing protein n=1 Tax=Xanthovirga aplysinae TaxID=2529853 RepID=UPI0012BCDD4F|nr:mechanosensitive ion channel domain-containing protein [Xanthovirga aplysinae]MTI33173.1 mechanosensitive ion channel [Xanthovirga aplysinae]
MPNWEVYLRHYQVKKRGERCIIPKCSCILLFLISFCFVLLPIKTVRAQIPQDTIAIAEEDLPYPKASIFLEAERSLAIIRRLIIKYDKKTLVEQETDELKKIREQIEETRYDPRYTILSHNTMRRLTDLKRRWNFFRSELKRLESKVLNRYIGIEEDSEILEELQHRWKVTQKAYKDLPVEARTREREVLREVSKAIKVLNNFSLENLSLQSEITGDLIDIEENNQRIDEYIKAYRNQILTQNEPPLWKALREPTDTLNTKEVIKESLKETKLTLERFKIENKKNINIHLLSFGLTLFFLVYLFLRLRKQKFTNKEQEYLAAFYSKPFVLAIYFNAFFVYRFYPQAATTINEIFILIALFTMAIALYHILDQTKFRALLYVISAFVFFFAHNLFLIISIVHRIYYFSLAIYLFILFRWLLKRGSPLRFIDHPIIPPTLFLINIGMIFSVVALLANLLGFYLLSRVIVSGLIYSLSMGTLLFMLVLMIRNFVSIIFFSKTGRALHIIKNFPDLMKKRIFAVINILAVIYWLITVSYSLVLYDPVMTILKEALETPIQMGTVEFNVGNLISFFVTIWVTILLSKFIQFLLAEEFLVDIPFGVRTTVSLVASYSLIAIGFLLAIAAAGIELDKLTIIFGALGVGIGFGFQNISNNLFSGMILAFERPFQVADIIEVGELKGRVKKLGFRSSVIRTFDGAEVIVPNAHLVSNEVINWTLSDHRRRVEIFIGVSYGTEPEKVRKTITQTLSQVEAILEDPPIRIYMDEFGQNALRFRIRFWVSRFEIGLKTKDAVTVALNKAFKKAGIVIAFPQRDIHIRSVKKGDIPDKKIPPDQNNENS